MNNTLRSFFVFKFFIDSQVVLVNTNEFNQLDKHLQYLK